MIYMEEKNQKSEKAFELHSKIINFGRRANVAFYDLAGIFKEIRDQKIYEDLGYKSFKEYLAIPEMPFELPTVYSYIRIREVAESIELDPAIFEELSYERFRILIPYINRENRDELISMARTMKKSELKKSFEDKTKNAGFEDHKPLPQVFRCATCGKVKWDAMPEEICGGHNA